MSRRGKKQRSANSVADSPATPADWLSPGGWRWALLSAAALVALAFVAYQPALEGALIWDDVDIYLVDNPLLRLDDGIYRFWFTTEPRDYYPLTYTTFWIEYQLWGLHPTGYHLVNVVLHALCGIVVWRLLTRLGIPLAWFAAALFVVHPLNVESVAWISQRKSVLAALLGFASLLAWLEFRACSLRRWLIGSLLLFALSLAAKPTMIFLPVWLAGYVAWTDGRPGFRQARQLAGFFAIAALFGAIGVWFQSERIVGEDLVRDQSLLARGVTAGWAVWFYLYKSLLPLNLSFVYPRWKIDLASPLSYVPSLSIAGVLAIGWRYRFRWGGPVFAALATYLLSLAPALGLVDVYYWRYAFVADHYQYQSLVVVLAIVVFTIDALLRRSRAFAGSFASRILPALPWAGGLVAIVMLLLTRKQAALYQSPELIWRDAITRNDRDFLARNNLGLRLLDRGEIDAASDLFQQAFAVNPEFFEAASNLGLCYDRRGEFQKAEAQYRAALAINSSRAALHRNLGNALLGQQRLDEAAASFNAAIAREPLDAPSHFQLGQIARLRKEPAEAINHYRAAVAADPSFAPAEQGLGELHEQTGNAEQAIAHYRRAIQFNPLFVEPRLRLGILLCDRGELPQAIASFEQALALEPANADAHHNLGAALAMSGHFTAAQQHFQQALLIDPHHAAAKQSLARLEQANRQ